MMNHAIDKPLFGKQESQELIQESRNQAKNVKIPESRRRKFRVAEPSLWTKIKQKNLQICFDYAPSCIYFVKEMHTRRSVVAVQHLCENRSYLHKIHLFVLCDLSPVLYVLSKLCKFH